MHAYQKAWASIALFLCAFASCQAAAQSNGHEVSIAPNSKAQQRGSASGPPPAVDLIIVVDNSASMNAEIESLQNGLYDHLVEPLLSAGVAMQVVMVARFGDLPSESVCIEEPLSSIPMGGCATPPALPGNTALYRQYSVEVGSHNAWCLLMDTFDGSVADEFALAPGGWQDWLQPDAQRVILVITDDGVVCGSYNDANTVVEGANAAEAIDAGLLALSPSHFGTTENRNYIVHGFIGIAENLPSTAPWPPTEPVTTLECSTAVDPGTGHQWLSVETGGFRFPSCLSNSYDVFFRMIAESIYPAVGLFRDRFEID